MVEIFYFVEKDGQIFEVDRFPTYLNNTIFECLSKDKETAYANVNYWDWDLGPVVTVDGTIISKPEQFWIEEIEI